jgi:hypothetical protein
LERNATTLIIVNWFPVGAFHCLKLAPKENWLQFRDPRQAQDGMI